MKHLSFILMLSGLLLVACNRKTAGVDSVGYRRTELTAYQELIDVLLDSAGFYTVDTLESFHLKDTLTEMELANELTKYTSRQFSIKEIIDHSKHKFSGEKVSVSAKVSEFQSHYWVTLSRISFENDMMEGYMQLGIWCGNLCAWSIYYEIEKVDSHWRVKSLMRGSVC